MSSEPSGQGDALQSGPKSKSRTRRITRRVTIVILILAGYVGISSLLHYIIFPEPGPDLSDLPRSGTTIVNEGIRSKFVYRKTAIETDGQLFELDNFVDSGGGPKDFPHVHPHMRESFEVVEGEMRFIVDGEEHIVNAGSKIVVEPGQVHSFENVSGKSAHMIARLEAAEDGPWEDLARDGSLPDAAFVQLDRAGGVGHVGVVQMIVFSTRNKQTYPPVGPTWVWDSIGFLIAPTARLFGVRAYYPPPAPKQ